MLKLAEGKAGAALLILLDNLKIPIIWGDHPVLANLAGATVSSFLKQGLWA